MVSFSENYDQGFAHLCSIKSCVTMYLKICLTPFWGASYHLKYNLPSCMLFIQAAGHAGDDPDAAAAAAAAAFDAAAFKEYAAKLRASGLTGARACVHTSRIRSSNSGCNVGCATTTKMFK